MVNFSLKGSDQYYLCLSDQPKRFDADSPATNVFFDDTNGQVFTVRSGGVTGVTVSGMDEAKSTSFRMEDRGPIISIKFSPDQNILAIQRNQDNQNATVEFVNFKDLAPTNVEYSHTCKWKSARILGFVWPKVNEIAFITDHGIELLQVLPEKKQLKSLKNTTFSGAWFQWCASSHVVLLAGNNGVLLQPFSLNNSSITKLQKLELDPSKPVVERDVFVIRVCEATWCAVFRHGSPALPGNTEVWLMPISGPSNLQYTHILKTGLSGRFAVSIVDDLVVVHHQSSQCSQIFDIMEESKPDGNTIPHIPIVVGNTMRPAMLGDVACPMYSATWVMFQPEYIIDARLGCLWRVQLSPEGLVHSVYIVASRRKDQEKKLPEEGMHASFCVLLTLPLRSLSACVIGEACFSMVPKEEISKIVAVLLRRSNCKETIYKILNQLVVEARTYLVELANVFDEINTVYRKWADAEMARNTAGSSPSSSKVARHLVVSQADMCTHVLQIREDAECIVQVVTAYMSSLTGHDMVVQQCVSELCVRTMVTRGAGSRLRALARRGGVGESKPLACALLSLAHTNRAHHQLATDMMLRLNAHQEIIEVLLSCNDPVTAVGVAKQAGPAVWGALPPRKVLGAARRAGPSAFVAVTHALFSRNERNRGSPHFLKSEQCDSYLEYYKELTETV